MVARATPHVQGQLRGHTEVEERLVFSRRSVPLLCWERTTALSRHDFEGSSLHHLSRNTFSARSIGHRRKLLEFLV